MLIVTGTKRSGTSMWMQIMIAAGFPNIGNAFPGVWEKSIKEANPHGFYESKFRQGLYFATNPDPETGNFLQPKNIKKHVVKIFVPGLIRTDYSYIGVVISTIRNWREYTTSLQRLFDMENTFLAESRAKGELPPARSFPNEKVEAVMKAGKLPPVLEWWFENYDLIRDMATRKYPFHMTTYDRLLRDPETEVSKVLKWLGEGNVEAAVQAVKPETRTQKKKDENPPDEFTAEFTEIFDELYDTIDRSQGLTAAFVDKLNKTNHELTKRWSAAVKQRVEAIQSGVEPSASKETTSQDIPAASPEKPDPS
jgi:hypothetical protein